MCGKKGGLFFEVVMKSILILLILSFVGFPLLVSDCLSGAPVFEDELDEWLASSAVGEIDDFDWVNEEEGFFPCLPVEQAVDLNEFIEPSQEEVSLFPDLFPRVLGVPSAQFESSRLKQMDSEFNKMSSNQKQDHCDQVKGFKGRGGTCLIRSKRPCCKAVGCHHGAKKGGFCISHGGGSRCSVGGCEASVKSKNLCATHRCFSEAQLAPLIKYSFLQRPQD